MGANRVITSSQGEDDGAGGEIEEDGDLSEGGLEALAFNMTGTGLDHNTYEESGYLNGSDLAAMGFNLQDINLETEGGEPDVNDSEIARPACASMKAVPQSRTGPNLPTLTSRQCLISTSA
ncbi:hypothetical protein DRE_01431 [Drechslerella stenobrocha 248]|uniref:Uncharacterized protein n=1 Tax=Drechslerella stenobrocha 248 TaxID=1043628 RepID=W7HKK7_9PEZI|nr:hypothetical protein DRE_01431 [Drechslerella stenobrocha 248]